MKAQRVTKWVLVFVVQGYYGRGWEDECSSLDRKEARADLKAYRENSQYPSRMIRRRVLRSAYESGNF